MIWEITAYNGTTMTFHWNMPIYDAINKFLETTNMTELDIKLIVNKH